MHLEKKRMSCRSFRGASAASGRGSPVSLGHSWIVGVPHYHTQAPVTLLSISRVVPLLMFAHFSRLRSDVTFTSLVSGEGCVDCLLLL